MDLFVKADQLKLLLREYVEKEMTIKEMLRYLYNIKLFRLKQRSKINKKRGEDRYFAQITQYQSKNHI